MTTVGLKLNSCFQIHIITKLWFQNQEIINCSIDKLIWNYIRNNFNLTKSLAVEEIVGLKF